MMSLLGIHVRILHLLTDRNPSIHAAKFNCSVPGTLFVYSSPDCLTAVTTSTSKAPTGSNQEATSVPTPYTPHYSIPDQATISLNSSDGSIVKDTKSRALFEVGSPLFYAVVGAGSGIIAIILCCLICVSAVLIYKHKKAKGEHIIYKHGILMNQHKAISALSS